MATLAATPVHWTAERKFFTGMAIAAFATAFVGFAPTYYLVGINPRPTPELTPRLHLHGLLCTLWILLFAMQAGLIATGRTALHRRTGAAGLVLVTAIFVSGLYVGINSERRVHSAANDGTLADPYVFLIFPFAGIGMFAFFAVMAVLFLRRPDIHKRLMLLATASLLGPALARIWGMTTTIAPNAIGALILINLYLAALAAYDWRTRGKLHPATLSGGGFLLISEPVRVLIGYSAPWRKFAETVMG